MTAEEVAEMCIRAVQRIARQGGRAPTYDPKKDPALKAYYERQAMSGKEEMETPIEYEISKLARSMYGEIMNQQGFRKLIKGILEIAKKQNEEEK